MSWAAGRFGDGRSPVAAGRVSMGGNSGRGGPSLRWTGGEETFDDRREPAHRLASQSARRTATTAINSGGGFQIRVGVVWS
jgi:hypothetical protein